MNYIHYSSWLQFYSKRLAIVIIVAILGSLICWRFVAYIADGENEGSRSLDLEAARLTTKDCALSELRALMRISLDFDHGEYNAFRTSDGLHFRLVIDREANDALLGIADTPRQKNLQDMFNLIVLNNGSEFFVTGKFYICDKKPNQLYVEKVEISDG